MSVSSNKPRVQIKDAFILGKHLWGYTVDHPLVSNNSLVRTSEIVAHHSTRCIETRNSIYEVVNWNVPDQVVKPTNTI